MGSSPAGPLSQAGAPGATLHPWNSCPALDSPSQNSGPTYRHLLTHLYSQQVLLALKDPDRAQDPRTFVPRRKPLTEG